MARILKKFLGAEKSYFLRASSDKEDKRLTLSLRDQLKAANVTLEGLAWQTCGLFRKSSGDSEGGQSRKVVRMMKRQERRKARQERMLKKRRVNSVNSTEAEGDVVEEEGVGAVVVGGAELNRDVGTGYTCGLWFLFHYITGKFSDFSHDLINENFQCSR